MVGKNRIRAFACYDAAFLVKRKNLVAEFQNWIEVVVDNHDTVALFLEFAQDRVDVFASGNVNGGGRLVENEHLRLHGDGAGKRQALALTARKGPRVIIDLFA